MKRQSVLVVATGALFFGALALQNGEPEAEGSYPVITHEVVPIPDFPADSVESETAEIETSEDTKPVSHQASEAVCVAGSCGPVSRGSYGTTTVRRGLFGRRIVTYSSGSYGGQYNRSAVRSSGRWYPGKNLGRLGRGVFGRRR
jgi:hypothetical protein